MTYQCKRLEGHLMWRYLLIRVKCFDELIIWYVIDITVTPQNMIF